VTAHPTMHLGAGLYCGSCGRRVSDGPSVEYAEIRAPDGRVRGRRAVAIVARCSCGAKQRVELRGKGRTR